MALRHAKQPCCCWTTWGPVRAHLLLDVLDEERRSSQVVHREVEEALDFLLMKVHCDDVSESCNSNISLLFVIGLLFPHHLRCWPLGRWVSDLVKWRLTARVQIVKHARASWFFRLQAWLKGLMCDIDRCQIESNKSLVCEALVVLSSHHAPSQRISHACVLDHVNLWSTTVINSEAAAPTAPKWAETSEK